MADERTYPCLPCPALDDSIAFYESLGFRRTYRQIRPNPYAVVAREDLQIHLFGLDDFDPAESYGNARMQTLPRMEAHVLDAGHKLLETHAAAAVPLMLDFVRRTQRESAGAV